MALKQWLNRFLRSRIGRIIGMVLFTLSLFLYQSFESRAVLGRWSHRFFAVIIVSALLSLITIFHAWRSRPKSGRREAAAHPGIPSIDLAIMFWGIAYFLSAIDDPTNAARIIGLNFFGSIMPLAVILEWISLLMLFVGTFQYAYSFLKKRYANILLLLGTIIGILLLGEGIIRFRALVFPATQGSPTCTTMLWGRRHAEFNREGFRDEEHSIAKAPDTKRLLIIGDSYAFGWGIKSIENRFGAEIGRRLTAKTGEHWEVINESRGDTHTRDHIRFLEHGMAYKPDVVLLLYVFNDIDYLYPITPRMFQSTFTPSAILFRNFYLFQEMHLRVERIRFRYLIDGSGAVDPYADQSLLAAHLEDISAFSRMAQDGGALVWVVPFDITVIVEEKFRERYRNFVDAAASSNIPVWSLENAFDNEKYSRLTVNNLDRHPNELAHRTAAQEIAGRLLEELQR